MELNLIPLKSGEEAIGLTKEWLEQKLRER